MRAPTILSRELLTAARRGWTYRQRVVLVGTVFGVLLLLVGSGYFLNVRPLSNRHRAVLAYFVFSAVANCQVLLSIWLVPACVAGAIADERERRTLTSVLTTRLSSAEIVLGKLAARLVQYTTCVAAGFPIVILLPILGGVDPRAVVLMYAGTASMAFFLAGLAILVSTTAQRGGRAIGATIGLASAWCGLPVFVQIMMPRTAPWLSPWVYPVNAWVLASTPTGVLLSTLGAGPGWRLLDSIYWMIGLQLTAGSILIAWAIAWFRAACRKHEGAGEYDVPRSRRWRWPRPACGANPVLWKELHTARPRGFAHALGALIALGLVALIGYGTYQFASPAFLEWFEHGLGPATSDISRSAFNQFLRLVTTWLEFFTLLIAAGVAAEGVTAERARDTWDGLIVTALEGRAILGAKMLGAAWKVRWGLVLLVGLWSVGLVTGSLHPLGFVLALVLLGAATWFMVALGTFMSLVSRDTAQASNRTLIPVLLLSGSFVLVYLPVSATTILMGMASAPLLNCLSLLSYGDVTALVSGQQTVRTLADMAIATGEGPLRVLAACLLGTTGNALAAAVFTRAALARFDRAVGRAERAPEERSVQAIPEPCLPATAS